jgi:predicted glycosyltransferase
MNFFIRFAKLTAWHDENKKGITDKLALQIVKLLEPYGKIHLSSERELSPELEPYRVKVKASDILDVLYYADLYLGDSQTMTAEAAVLGTPSLRFNDFVGKLGYLEELEHKYQLTYGIPTDQPEKLLEKLKELVSIPQLKATWEKRRNSMLEQTIDPTRFMVWFFENYPESARTMINDKEYINRFRDNGS